MNKIKILFLTFILIAFSSCSSWLDVNTDPNYPSTLPSTMPLTAGMASASTIIGGQYATMGGLWSQFYTQDNTANQYKTWDSYQITPGFMNGEYSKIYTGALYDFKRVIKDAEEVNDWNSYLIATVMDVYTYQVLVDLYGQIPYTEACMGSENTKPKFDNGSDIYIDLLARLDKALAQDFELQSNVKLTNEDLVFNGNIALWKDFANTLKLKIAIRQYAAKPTESAKIINDMLAAGTQFLTEDASVKAYKDQPGQYNPLFDTQKGTGNANLRASNTTLNYLVDNNDTRLSKMYLKGNEGTYLGLPQGAFSTPTAVAPQGSLSKLVMASTDPVVFMSEAESYFLQAEALLKCKAGAGVKDMYNKGVTAAFARFDIASDAEEMITKGGKYEYTAQTEKDGLDQIITQKWLSMFLRQGLEAFFEFNRTGYPTIFTPSVESIFVDKKAFPRRLVFPQYELNSNADNVPARVEPEVNQWWAK